MPAPIGPAANSMSVVNQLRNNTHRNWWQDHGLRKLTLFTLLGYLGTVNSGYDGSLMNGLLAMPIFVKAIDDPDANKLGIITASYALGSIIGIPLVPVVSDRFGRRMAIAVGAVLIIIGAVVQTFTKGGYDMLAGRLVVGIGAAFQGIASPAYVSELTHPRNRPQATALINTCWYVGSIISAWLTFGTLNIATDWCWRLPCLVQALPGVLQLSFIWWTPESVRWLVSKGRTEEAYDILCTYHANGDRDDELVLYEFDEIKEAIAAEKIAEAGSTYKSFFKTKGNRRRLLILIMVGFYSQWVGNGIISYYFAKILTSIGFTDPTRQAGLNGGLQIWNWLLAIAGAMLVERLGRRFLWLTSAIGMLIFYIIITACSAVYAKNESVAAGYVTIACLFLYFGSYDIAFTGLTLAYPVEILPFNLRSKGLAILQMCIQAALFFNQYVNPIALEKLGWKYYIVYDVVLVCAILSIYFVYPETKGLLLEEITEIFDGADATVHHATMVDGRVVGDAERDSKNDEKLDETEKVEHAAHVEYR